MYDNLVRSWAMVSRHLRPETVSRHSGSPREFLKRCRTIIKRKLKKGRVGIKEVAPYLFGWIADSRTLRCAWEDLVRRGGTSPGPNGHRYEDLDDHAVWRLCRCLVEALRDGTYRPGLERVRTIPKRSGHGERPLVLQSIEDRLVQRAIMLIVQPLLDPGFDLRSVGYRPKKDRLDGLALAEAIASEGPRWVWVTEDLKDAFLHVPLSRLLQLLKKRLIADDLVQLIGCVLGDARTPGLRQGGPLSPLLLNVFLDHHLDRPWRKVHEDVPLIRAADDLLLLCRTRKQAEQSHAALVDLLTPAGPPTKLGFEKAAHDLRGAEHVNWLGFQIRKARSGLAVQVGEDSWARLQETLAHAHEEPDSPLRAELIVTGWLSQMGPCYNHVDLDEACHRIIAIAHGQAFDEIPSAPQLEYLWNMADVRWCRVRKRTRKLMTRTEASVAG